MQRPGVPSPLSPLSYSSNDSSFAGRYGAQSGPGGAGSPNEPNYFAGVPHGGGVRPAQTSPPSSQHHSSSTDMSRPSASSFGGRPPSSASSMGMSSDGRMGFSKPNTNRDSTRSQFNADNEEVLARHYRTLKSYLSTYLAEEKANSKSNRARDKLLRLSVTQFLELSTDVYDELIRREDQRQGRIENVPHFLLPKQNFHPKRNQARQKLSTLPLDRFRQLATDVFYELERRIPRFASPDNSRAPSRGGMRPPPGYNGAPFPPGGPRRGPYSPGMPPPGNRRPSEAASLGRPLPKTFQSNTIVPNKGTMVEEDDGSDDEDEFAFNAVLSPRSAEGNAESQMRIQAQDAEIAELKDKLEGLESQLLEKDAELDKASGSGQDLEEERKQWQFTREELEQKAMDAQALNNSLRQELDQMRRHQTQELEERVQENERLRRQLDQQEATTGNDDYERRIAILQEELATQERISTEVREEATMYLQEMRDLSRQNDRAVEQEEKLASKVGQLEKDIEDWRQRYARVKAQNRSLRASTMGLGLKTGGFDHGGELARPEQLVSHGGLVRDVDVTRFQLAVDELLQVARQPGTDAMLDSVKNVVISVQSITAAVGTDGYPTPSPSPPGPHTAPELSPSVGRLKARVTGTANSLITATKQHAASMGLSPVALLDAAASNLTASVVELIKAVRIRPSNSTELADPVPISTTAATANNNNKNTDVSSFYNEIPSPATADTAHITDAFPQPPQHQHGPIPATSAAPLPLRTSSAKKANGWFGWGAKRSPAEEDAVASPHESEYDFR